MDYFVGEILQFAGTFAPDGTLECAGQLVSVNDYQALYSLIGTTYGGNGTTTFGLPNLNGRLAMHVDSTQPTPGAATGVESVTLTQAQLPAHTHALAGSTAQATSIQIGNGNVLASTPANVRPYADITKPIANIMPLDPRSVGNTGGSQPHLNVMPTACVRYAICWQGIYPNF